MFQKEKVRRKLNNYKRQRKFCVKLLRQIKENHFSEKVKSVINNSISNNKKFWKTTKPFFCIKDLSTNNLMLAENNKIVREEETIADIMNNYFTNITTNLKLKPRKYNKYLTKS